MSAEVRSGSYCIHIQSNPGHDLHPAICYKYNQYNKGNNTDRTMLLRFQDIQNLIWHLLLSYSTHHPFDVFLQAHGSGSNTTSLWVRTTARWMVIGTSIVLPNTAASSNPPSLPSAISPKKTSVMTKFDNRHLYGRKLGEIVDSRFMFIFRCPVIFGDRAWAVPRAREWKISRSTMSFAPLVQKTTTTTTLGSPRVSSRSSSYLFCDLKFCDRLFVVLTFICFILIYRIFQGGTEWPSCFLYYIFHFLLASANIAFSLLNANLRIFFLRRGRIMIAGLTCQMCLPSET